MAMERTIVYFTPQRARVSIFLFVCSVCAIAAGRNQAEKPVKGPVVQNVQQDRATVTWATGNGQPDFHSIDLTGLEPGRRYEIDLHKYGLDGNVAFETAPSDSRPFSFVVFGDTRSRHDVHRRIVDLILRERPSFVIHTGDLVGNGDVAGDWDRFFEIEHDLLSTTAFYPVLGNHERNAEAYYRYFSFPNGDGQRYSFDWGTAHIAVLDTNEFGKDPFDQEVSWLRDDLARNTKPLVFVAFHHPLYTAVENRRGSAAKLASTLEPVLQQARVTAVFGGHDHDYQHHLKDGIHYVVAGGGGAPLYDGSAIRGLTVKLAKIENFVRIRVSGNQAHVEAIDIEGRLLDSFDVTGRERGQPVTDKLPSSIRGAAAPARF